MGRRNGINGLTEGERSGLQNSPHVLSWCNCRYRNPPVMTDDVPLEKRRMVGNLFVHTSLRAAQLAAKAYEACVHHSQELCCFAPQFVTLAICD